MQEAGVITGFCYPYARLLLDKALELKKDGKIFERPSNLLVEDGRDRDLTPFADVILDRLQEQVSHTQKTQVGSWSNPAKVDEFLDFCTSYLSIFEPAQLQG